MNSTSLRSAPIAFPSPGGGWGRRMRALAVYIDGYFARREAIKALARLDDRQLRDIGLLRSHIQDAVTGAANPELGRLR